MIEEFVNTYFVEPISMHTGYNAVNLLVFAVVLLFVAFKVVYPYFSKRMEFDWAFLRAVFPFVLFGSMLRVFEEPYSNVFLVGRSGNPLELGFYFVTPGIWFLVGGIAIGALFLLSKRFADRRRVLAGFGLTGWVFALPLLLHHLAFFTQPLLFAGVFLTAARVFAACRALTAVAKKQAVLVGRLNQAVLFSQALDAAAPFVGATALGLNATLFTTGAIMGFLSPAALLVVKPLLALALLSVIRSEAKDKNFQGFLKVFIVVVSLATGLHSSFSIALLKPQ